MLAGLRLAQKSLSPKFFYNEKGSELFEAITRLPEYYLTRTELSIFDDSLGELAAEVPGGQLRRGIRVRLEPEDPQGAGGDRPIRLRAGGHFRSAPGGPVPRAG